MNFKKHLRSIKYEKNLNYCRVFRNYIDKSEDIIKDILNNKFNTSYKYITYNSFNNALNKSRKFAHNTQVIHILVIENKIAKGLFVYTMTKSEAKYKAFYDLEKMMVFQ